MLLVALMRVVDSALPDLIFVSPIGKLSAHVAPVRSVRMTAHLDKAARKLDDRRRWFRLAAVTLKHNGGRISRLGPTKETDGSRPLHLHNGAGRPFLSGHCAHQGSPVGPASALGATLAPPTTQNAPTGACGPSCRGVGALRPVSQLARAGTFLDKLTIFRANFSPSSRSVALRLTC